LFLSKTGVNCFIQLQQSNWQELYTCPLENLNNYLHHFIDKKYELLSDKTAENIVPVQFYLGKTFLLKVNYIHHLQNIFFNLSHGHELFPFPFNPYPEEITKD
jgi:endonuclease III-like uncharacterized protein